MFWIIANKIFKLKAVDHKNVRLKAESFGSKIVDLPPKNKGNR